MILVYQYLCCRRYNPAGLLTCWRRKSSHQVAAIAERCWCSTLKSVRIFLVHLNRVRMLLQLSQGDESGLGFPRSAQRETSRDGKRGYSYFGIFWLLETISCLGDCRNRKKTDGPDFRLSLRELGDLKSFDARVVPDHRLQSRIVSHAPIASQPVSHRTLHQGV